MAVKDKQQSYFVSIGSSSLLVIFLVLCLVTFAILSLSGARSDYMFSEKLADHRKLYYEASARAEEIVDEIDRILSETVADNVWASLYGPEASGEEGTEEIQAYFTGVGEAVSGIQADEVLLQVRQTEKECIISFQVPVGNEQALSVMLQVTDYRENENYYEIKVWKTVNTRSWEGEQPLNLMPTVQE